MALLNNDIYVGSVSDPLYHFTNAQIELGGAKGSFAVDVLSNELPVDQFNITVRPTDEQIGAIYAFITSDNKDYITSDDNEFYVLNEDGEPDQDDIAAFMNSFRFGTPVWWRVEGNHFAKGYLNSVNRISKRGFKIICTSGVGLLENKMHPGGVYLNEPIASVIDSIVGNTFSYAITNNVRNTATVSGHLPYDTARNNLHRVLFACGAIIGYGYSIWDYLIDYPLRSASDIPPSAVAMQGSVQYQLPANKVEITEHAFFETSDVQAETLYESNEIVDHLLVLFDKPIIATSIPKSSNTLTIIEANENYAIVSGVGTLTGKPYTHTTQVRELVNNPGGDKINVKRVTDNECINSINSLNIAKRVLSYYQNAKTVKIKTVLKPQVKTLFCGFPYRFQNPYGEVENGYLTKCDALVTSVVGSQCTFVTGYVPNANGNTFTNRLTVNADYAASHNNKWTVPDGVTYIRLVLISGGDGGQGGKDGDNGLGQANMISGSSREGHFAYGYSEQAIPQGGDPGASGAQGKVYIVERTVTPREEITFTIGVGGTGGARGGVAGNPGTPTTALSDSLGLLTSDSGVTTIGYQEPFSGEVYATPGEDGIRGGDGGRTDTISLYGNRGGDGLSGEDVANSKGGAGGNGDIKKWEDTSDYYFSYAYASGGGGGGAAFGTSGGVGGNGIVTVTTDTGRPIGATSGNGGAGANAVAHSKPTMYGRGGGGNGGGAGGNAGAAMEEVWPPQIMFTFGIGAAGVGGQGSAGGAGGDGVAIIYW